METTNQKINSQYLRAVAEVLEQAVESVLDEMVWTENRFEYSDLDSLRERLSFAKFKCCDIAAIMETRDAAKLNQVAREVKNETV